MPLKRLDNGMTLLPRWCTRSFDSRSPRRNCSRSDSYSNKVWKAHKIIAISWQRRTIEPMITRLQFRSCLVVGFAVLLISPSGLAQGTFQNLDFEAAQIPPGTTTGSGLPIISKFPGWSVFYNNDLTDPVTYSLYDNKSLGGPAIAIVDRPNQWGRGPLQGIYSAWLFGGTANLGGRMTMTISQTGLVPNAAVSIEMDLMAPQGFAVSLGGQAINMVPLQTFSSYTLYGGDVSAFAGQTAQLTITAPAPPYGSIDPTEVLVDDIRFVTIPEPSVCALAALGTLLVGWRMRLLR